MLAGYGGDALQVLARGDATGWIGRRVQDHEAGPGRDQRGQFVGVEAEAVLLADRAGDRAPTDIAGHRFVDREARIRVDDLVALIDESKDGDEHDQYLIHI